MNELEPGGVSGASSAIVVAIKAASCDAIGRLITDLNSDGTTPDSTRSLPLARPPCCISTASVVGAAKE